MLPVIGMAEILALLRGSKVIRDGYILLSNNGTQIIGYLKETGSLFGRIQAPLEIAKTPLELGLSALEIKDLQEISDHLQLNTLLTQYGLGVSFATLGVSIASHAIIYKKLKKLEKRLETLEDQMKALGSQIRALKIKNEALDTARFISCFEELEVALSSSHKSRQHMLINTGRDLGIQRSYYETMLEHGQVWYSNELSIDACIEIYNRFTAAMVAKMHVQLFLGEITSAMNLAQSALVKLDQFSFDKKAIFRRRSEYLSQMYDSFTLKEIRSQMIASLNSVPPIYIETKHRIKLFLHECKFIQKNGLSIEEYKENISIFENYSPGLLMIKS